MVLLVLGVQISYALSKISNDVLDEQAVLLCLHNITLALHRADVNWGLLLNFRSNVKKSLDPIDLAAGHDKRKIMQQAVLYELCALLEPGKPAYTPQIGRQCVVMFAGLQGSGKTTTCLKYARYYQKKGWKPSLVCADTFRAGAFDQLKQNAVKANIPFFGGSMEMDPVTVAKQGIEKLKKENSDLIIVDTSGGHTKQAFLFEEMRRVSEKMSPDLVILVMDSSMGQAAFDQALEFRKSVPMGAVIITKMDRGTKGGGALSACAAAKIPVDFLGTGEHLDDFEPFEVKSFASRLLGMGNRSAFFNRIDDVVKIFTLRSMYDQFHMKMTLGRLNLSIPDMTSGKKSQARMKKFMMIMDSMTNAELDSTNLKIFSEPSRVNRIARGSGHSPRDVKELLVECKRQANMYSKLNRVI